MKELLDKIDSKIITSVGGVLLAGIMAYFWFQSTREGNTSIVRSIEAHNAETIVERKELNITLKELNKSIQDNTNAMRDIQVLIRQTR